MNTAHTICNKHSFVKQMKEHTKAMIESCVCSKHSAEDDFSYSTLLDLKLCCGIWFWFVCLLAFGMLSELQIIWQLKASYELCCRVTHFMEI